MKIKLLGTFSLILLICGGWGFLVHRTVNQMAVYELPDEMRPFFYRHMDYIVKNSVRADQRRNQDSTEAPKHFIDFEVYGDSAAWKMTRNWEAAKKTFTEDSLLKYGYLPYVVMKVKHKLTNAFRQKNKDSILFYSADLAHYIADAHVPLHTTLNYDGQLTNQKGLHSLWESMIPEIELNQYQLSSKHKATYLKKPEQKLWQAMQYAHVLLNDVLKMETEASKEFVDSVKYRTQIRRGRESKSYSTAFAKAYSKKLGNTINQQLISSANLISDFWYTSWVDGGKPDLCALLSPKFSKQEEKDLKQEVKDFKANELLKKNKLISKKPQEASTGE